MPDDVRASDEHLRIPYEMWAEETVIECCERKEQEDTRKPGNGRDVQVGFFTFDGLPSNSNAIHKFTANHLSAVYRIESADDCRQPSRPLSVRCGLDLSCI